MVGGWSIEGECTPPLGFQLLDIIWDVDREVFLSRTVMCHQGSPIAFIPMDIETHPENGWQIGSWQKSYDHTWKSSISESLVGKFDLDWDNEEELYLLETTPPSQRQERFNQLFSAIVRMLFMLRNNEAVGFAMYKSKMYFQDEKNRSSEFSRFIDEFGRMGAEDREKVRRNVMRQSAKFA